MDQVDQSGGRRLNSTRVLLLVWLGLGVVVALAVCYILSAAFRPRPAEPIALGSVDDYAPNSIDLHFVNTVFFDETTNKEIDTLPLDIVRDPAGNFTVFFARSTHPEEGARIPRQCVVEWDASLEKFIELCGGSQWTRDGKYYAGPAPRDLDQFPVTIENGRLAIEPKPIKGAVRP